ncbi:hypothetical protein TWF694_006849 [Orbilia ellipsospora]|uniref:Uncharacterized protein n=1 Tax=Orbilia ellipsospora TaxID=2528407 RepID=A0AAV9XMB4_9PEZI
MAFDGPYPSHSDSMEKVIFNALLSPNYEDADDVVSTAPSTKRVFKLPLPFRSWFRSHPLLRRLKSFGLQSDVASVASCSSVSLPSIAADEILNQLPEGNSSISKLAKSIQDIDKCFTRSAADDTDSDATETTCISQLGSLKGSFGSSRAVEIMPTRFPGTHQVPGSGIKRHKYDFKSRRKRASKIRERYLEVNDGIWDTVAEIFIPNAWPIARIKTAIKRPMVGAKDKMRHLN